MAQMASLLALFANITLLNSRSGSIARDLGLCYIPSFLPYFFRSNIRAILTYAQQASTGHPSRAVV
jgi:hypothetical protein